VTVQTAVSSRRKGIPTAAYETRFNEPGTETTDTIAHVDGRYSTRLARRFGLEAHATYDAYDYDGAYRYDRDDGGVGTFDDWCSARSAGAEVAVAGRLGRHTVTTGVEGRWDFREEQGTSDWTGPLLLSRERSATVGVYAQEDMRVSRLLSLTGGLRFDAYDGRTTLNPRVGAVVRPGTADTLKVVLARAFRAPSDYELHYYPRTKPLEPETIWTSEFEWQRRFGPHTVLQLAAFRYRVDDLIVERAAGDTPSDDLTYENSGGAAATGVEVEAWRTWSSGLRVQGAVAYADARDLDRLQLDNSPQWTGRASGILPLGKTGLTLGMTGVYTGERLNADRVAVPGAFVAGLTVTRRQVGPLDVVVSAHNLFDTDYADPGSNEVPVAAIPQDGRTVMVRTTWRF
jgi:iron complex outermembrane receptor protein